MSEEIEDTLHPCQLRQMQEIPEVDDINVSSKILSIPS